MSISNLEKLRYIINNDDELKNMKGAVLYSSHKTLIKSKYYYLGLNPGGEGGASILLDHLKLAEKEKFNVFIEEKWNNSLQEKSIKLFDFIGTSIEEVCSSNLIFKQSKDQASLGKIEPLADICWKVHKVIIEEIVKPEFIISHGRTVFHSLTAHRGFEVQEKNVMWIAKKDNVTLINFPHLSGGQPPYDPFSSNEKETLNKFKELILG